MTDLFRYPYQEIRLQTTIKSTSDTATNSTAVTLLYQNPLGTVTSIAYGSLTNSTTGVYSYLVTPTSSEAGDWLFGFRSTSTEVPCSDFSGRFVVEELPFTT